MYMIRVKQDQLNSIVDFKDKSTGLLCIPPWQVLTYRGEQHLSKGVCIDFGRRESGDILQRFRLLSFEICNDYKKYVTWQRKAVIKNEK